MRFASAWTRRKDDKVQPQSSLPLYDEIADWYANLARADSWVHRVLTENLSALVGDIDERRVLDVACGEGVFSRLLANQGADVVGVDLSPRLIALAIDTDIPRSMRLTYHVDDAQTLATFDADSFDGAVCMMALMDIPDLEATCRSVRRVVKMGGWFVVAITHPCFDAPHATWEDEVPNPDAGRVIRSYLDEGLWRSHFSGGVRGKVGAWHRTLGTYLNTMIATGWTLEQLVEPAGGVEGQNLRIPRLAMMRFCEA